MISIALIQFENLAGVFYWIRHNISAVNYNRINVYPRLGFDKFIDQDDFSNPATVRTLISDKEMVRKMISDMNVIKRPVKSHCFYLQSVSKIMQIIQKYGGQKIC